MKHDWVLLAVTRVVQDGNGIGDRGAEMIGEGLKVNSRLERLHVVSLCFAFSFAWGDAGIGMSIVAHL